ncbi:MAG: SBBP repeat-containing protein [Bacteroidetes bacterium]|nr:SBBP repeat-containing protein [Bacteroidota bacterium]
MRQKKSTSLKLRLQPFIGLTLLLMGHSHAQNNVVSKNTLIRNLEPETRNLLNGSGLCFTPNKGQIADMEGKLCPDVLYKGETAGADIYLRKTGISYVYSNMGEVMHNIDEQVEDLIKAGTITEMDEHKKKKELLQKENFKVHRVDMDFEGSTTNPKLINEEEVDGYQNFYYAYCPQGITHVKQYNKITYKNIYNGIDMAYYGDKTNGIKYDLIVKPHADPSQIKLHWKGAESIYLNREGDLVIKTSVNEFTESIPKVYQVINGKVVDVKAEYKLYEMLDVREKNNTTNNSHISCLKSHIYEVTFELGTWNQEHPLVIDPWATYYGGNNFDLSSGIDTDNSGNVIITGMTRGGTFPAKNAGGLNITWQSSYKGGLFDAFVVKLGPNGNRLWATYYGGNQWDQANDIATDNAGNIIITGENYGGFPATNAGGVNVTWQAIYVGTYATAFVVKFDSNGKRLWATYYGGDEWVQGEGIATDNLGNVIIVGTTRGGTFSATNAGGLNITWQNIFGGGLNDAFVVKFDPNGNRLWATYYGGDKNDYGNGIATDNAGNILITGCTGGGSFSATNAGGPNVTWQTSYGGGVFDAFVVKFGPNGNRLWATYYGGNQLEYIYGSGIAIDFSDNVIITGGTGGAFPVGANGPNIVQQVVFGGLGIFNMGDAYLVKFNSFGVMQWATYCGGIQDEIGFSLTTDGSNNVYLLMEIEDQPGANLIDACSYQPEFNGGSNTNPSPNGGGIPEDQLIVKFSPLGKKICSTYIGGTGEDDSDGFGSGKMVTIFGNSLYITGTTDGGYPVSSGAFQTKYGGEKYDAFITSICANICEGKILALDYIANTTSACVNVPVTFTPSVANSCDTTGYKYQWKFTGGSPSTSSAVKPIVTFAGVGAYDVKLVVTTVCKKDSLTKTNYITVTQCAACNLVAKFTKGTANCTGCGCKEWIMVNATGGTNPYTYLWPDGYDKRYKNHLCSGNYSINITDKNGCSVNVNLTAP